MRDHGSKKTFLQQYESPFNTEYVLKLYLKPRFAGVFHKKKSSHAIFLLGARPITVHPRNLLEKAQSHLFIFSEHVD